MNAGRLRFLVNLQRDYRVADTLGGFTTTWTSVYTNVYANIEQPSGGDVFKFGKQIEKLNTKITIRYNKHVRAGWRVVMGGRTYNVKFVINADMDYTYSILFCDEAI